MTSVDDAAARLAVALVTEAAALVRGRAPRHVTTKDGPADLATDVDLEVERFVVAELRSAFPGHRIVGEETGAHGPASAEATWYLDPVDGTTNLAAGIGWCAVSLALADARGPAVAAVADVHRGEVVAAARGQGAWLGGQGLRCSPARSLAGTVVTTELVGNRPWPGFGASVSAVAERGGTVRLMGSSALAVTLVAAGRAAGALLGAWHDVDDLAALLLAREAGAVVRGRSGGDEPEPDGVLVAAPGVAEELAACWADRDGAPQG